MGAEAGTEINVRSDLAGADPRGCPADAAMAKSPRATAAGCPYINPIEFVVTHRLTNMLVRAIALLVFFITSGLPSFAQERVRIGVSSRGFGSLPLFVADKKGFYAKYGFRPETVLLRSSVAVPALLSGDLDFYNGFQPAVSAALRGIPIKLVMMGAEKVIFMILVKPEVKSLNDLKGKTIGVSSAGSTIHLSLLTILNQFRIDAAKDVKILPAGDVRSQLAAMQAGRIDAASHGPPLDTLGTALGYKILLWDKDHVDIPISGLDVSDQKLQKAPEQVKRMIKALIESQRFIRSQKDESTKLIGEWMSVDAATADNLYKNLGAIFSIDGTLTERALRASIQMESELAKTHFTVPLSTIFDNRVLLDAQQELRKDRLLK
jgi:NitT/TauT family transport system substrate-binding protein